MPRIQESTRRRNGGGGTHGIRGGVNGFYQRRKDEANTPFWSDTTTTTADGGGGGDVSEEQNTNLTEVFPASRASESAPIAPIQTNTHNKTNALKKNLKRNKKRFLRQSMDTLLLDNDDDINFGSNTQTNSTHMTRSEAPSFTPKISQDKKSSDLPWVTPAGGTLFSAAMVAPKRNITTTTSSSPESTHHEPWESPLPLPQNASSALLQASRTQMVQSSINAIKEAHRKEVQELSRLHQNEMEIQNRKNETEIKRWKSICETSETTANNLEFQLKKQKEITEQGQAQAIQTAVEHERLRLMLQWSQERKQLQTQVQALQEQLLASERHIRQIELAKFQEMGGHHNRLQFMAHTLVALTKGQRETQEENQRQKQQLEAAHAAEITWQRTEKAWKAREQVLVQRELAVERREKELKNAQDSTKIFSSSSRPAAASSSGAIKSAKIREALSAPQTVQYEGLTSSKPAQQSTPTTATTPVSSEALKHVSIASSSRATTTNKNNKHCHHHNATSMQQLQAKSLHPVTQPLKCSAPESNSKKRRLKDVIPTYNFMGVDMSVGLKKTSSSSKRSFKQKHSRRKHPKVIIED